MSVVDEYRRRRDEPSDIWEHLPTLYAHVVAENARVVVELGVRSGNSTAALLAAVELTGGHLWSVDIDTQPAGFDNHPQWTFIQGNDLATADQLPATIDVLFIDTSHHYEHTLAELRLYGPRSRWIVLHDTELEHPDGAPRRPSFPVKKAIECWSLDVGRRWTNRTNCYGLGIIHPEEAR